MTDIDAAATAKAERATQLVANADLRIQIVQREINHVLGLGRDHVQLADFGAALVIAALDSFDDSDTKALVETATRLGRELGRREAAEELPRQLQDAADRWRAQAKLWDTGTTEQRGTPQQVADAWGHAAELRSWMRHLNRADILLDAPEIATKEPK